MKRHLDNLIHQITADKKKLGIMLSALALGLLLWGRLLLQGVPRTATADDPERTVQSTDNNPDSGGQALQIDKPIPVVHVDLASTPGRDPFGIDPSRYKQNPGASRNALAAKSTQVTPDEDSRTAVVRQEVMGLRLESVVTGTRPRAYINGRLLAPGDEYEGFKLIQVTDRYVLLTKYGLIIRLRM